MGFDARESTPGLKRNLVVVNSEVRSNKRASLLIEETHGFKVSPNTVNRICQEVGEDLAAAQASDWQTVLTGEVPVPAVAIVECDGGRIHTRTMDSGPGVHLSGTGWNETKNAIFVSATSETSEVDPQPDPPECFLNPKRVAKLTETAQTKEKAGESDDLPPRKPTSKKPKTKRKPKKPQPPHKPKRILRTVISSMKNSHDFGVLMQREAKRRRFFEASRRAFVADGLACNWTIHAEHFRDFTPILDFTHAVTYLFRASQLCCAKDDAWTTYARWMTSTWRGQVGQVIDELREHQERLGLPPEDSDDDDPREQLRLVIGYLENHRTRMHYAEYRRQGLPTTSAWIESAVKEINYRVKGTEMFWNNPAGAEPILQIRAARLCDDGRLARFLARRPGNCLLRRPATLAQAA